MKNYRKLMLGILYLGSCLGIAILHIFKSPVFDGVGLAAIFGGLSSGVGFIVWGNVKEHECNKTNT